MVREPLKAPWIELARWLSRKGVCCLSWWPEFGPGRPHGSRGELWLHTFHHRWYFLTPSGRLWIRCRDSDSEFPSFHKKKNTVGRLIPSDEPTQVALVAGKCGRGEKGSWDRQRTDTGVQESWAGSQVEIRQASLEPHRDHLKEVVIVLM